ncbi:hypothetical protein AB1Y20_019519 [Prymnesium parvum]|uniref:Phosphatidylinositol 3,4,5-trisphosphate 3-phosphatase and dual-specificity protein phosphatase PTEN n=1 Tax=Prymnesium parvum TaxID=97485 RepID=A0AB34JUD0_PRYPA
MPVFFVQRGGTPPAGVPPTLEGPLVKRGGATGQRGGIENWKTRHCKLVGYTLYYLEADRSAHARGHLNLQGLGVRQADAETGRALSICLFWPEDAEANFYLQAPSEAARDTWMHALREATCVSNESIAQLGIAELKRRCVVCGLVGYTDYSHERAELEAMLIEQVRRRAPMSDAQIPLSVLAALAENTGQGATVMAGAGVLDGWLTKLRGMVSLNKTRFQKDGFDLDLTYITPRIIAMGFPASGFEGKYRNNLHQVQRFLGTFHPANRYRVYNLCEERVYEGHVLGGETYRECLHHYPFDDHNPPCFDMIHPFCLDVREWLERHPDNVAAVHCKAGKGRTGLMVSCLLYHLQTEHCDTAQHALDYFGNVRTHDGEGVTIPSQKRYTRWYAEHFAPEAKPLEVKPPDERSDSGKKEGDGPTKEGGRLPVALRHETSSSREPRASSASMSGRSTECEPEGRGKDRRSLSSEDAKLGAWRSPQAGGWDGGRALARISVTEDDLPASSSDFTLSRSSAMIRCSHSAGQLPTKASIDRSGDEGRQAALSGVGLPPSQRTSVRFSLLSGRMSRAWPDGELSSSRRHRDELPGMRTHLGRHPSARDSMARRSTWGEGIFPKQRGKIGAAPQKWAVEQPVMRVVSLSVKGAPNMEHGACHPFLVVRRSELVSVDNFGAPEAENPRILPCTCVAQRHRKIFDSRDLEEVEKVKRGGDVAFNCGSESAPLLIKGDTKFIIFDKEKMKSKRTICHFWVHTFFLHKQGGRIVLRRRDLDKACKSKYDDKFPPDFEITLVAVYYAHGHHFQFDSEMPDIDERMTSFPRRLDTDDDTDDDEQEGADCREDRSTVTMMGMLNNKRRDYSTAF